jgi:hypothetical protein
MENNEDEMASNIIIEWTTSDKGLYAIIQEIEKEHLSNNEKAEMAYHRVSEYFKVPKEFDAIDSEGKYQSCVYEQLGYLKYLEADDNDIRGLVMTAIYFVKFGYETNIEEVHKKYYSNNKEIFNGIGFRGDNSSVELVFVKQGESWFDLGCKYYTKQV